MRLEKIFVPAIAVIWMPSGGTVRAKNGYCSSDREGSVAANETIGTLVAVPMCETKWDTTDD